jgi:hypothetical protein
MNQCELLQTECLSSKHTYSGVNKRKTLSFLNSYCWCRGQKPGDYLRHLAVNFAFRPLYKGAFPINFIRPYLYRVVKPCGSIQSLRCFVDLRRPRKRGLWVKKHSRGAATQCQSRTTPFPTIPKIIQRKSVRFLRIWRPIPADFRVPLHHGEWEGPRRASQRAAEP